MNFKKIGAATIVIALSFLFSIPQTNVCAVLPSKTVEEKNKNEILYKKLEKNNKALKWLTSHKKRVIGIASTTIVMAGAMIWRNSNNFARRLTFRGCSYRPNL
ncbi:hypothetical protein FACS189465_1820 [Clostridia bacterium]|nr:hypothetical protein FACS189465_1820 [Clostridia bacterium]